MGEAKRRKKLALNPNYGEPARPNNSSLDAEKIGDILNLVTQLDDEICYDIFKSACSTEWIGDLIESPQTLSMLQLLNSSVYPIPEDFIEYQETIEKIAKVCDLIRQEDNNTWWYVYRILLLGDRKLFLSLFQCKNYTEIQDLLRAMVVFAINCPDPTDEEEENVWDHNNKLQESALSLHFEARLTQLYSNPTNFQKSSKLVTAFSKRIAVYIVNQNAIVSQINEVFKSVFSLEVLAISDKAQRLEAIYSKLKKLAR